MHKNKDGKVVASLTEVKNKTGDIFAIVDEYGEITLTSYNKPRYRITKVDIADSLIEKTTKSAPKSKPTKSKKAKKSKSNTKKSRSIKKETKQVKTTQKVAKTEPQAEVEKDNDIRGLIQKMQGYKNWDRNSRNEKRYMKKARKPL